jgi:DNA-binding IscR family transcriptional regulator
VNVLAIRWALKRKIGSSYAKAVLVDLAVQTDGKGLLVRTFEEIAHGTGMKVGTVRRKIRWLKSAGYIEVFRGAHCCSFRLRFDKADYELD